jgi:hypothetical protein
MFRRGKYFVNTSLHHIQANPRLLGRFVNKWKKIINEKYQSLIQNEISSINNLLRTKGTQIGCKCLCTR